jgi:hypothetical protein
MAMKTHPKLKNIFTAVLITWSISTASTQVKNTGQLSASSGIKNATAMISSTPLFLPVVNYDTGGLYTTSVAVADFNGDGRADLAVVNNGNGTVGVLLGNGNGTFQPAIIYGSGSYWAVSVAVADVNGDHKSDLLVSTLTSSGGAGIGVLLGNGDGTFQPAVVYSSNGDLDYSVAVADVNGDGQPDLVVTKLCVNCATGAVDVLLGNGDGTFQSATRYDSGGRYAAGVAVRDVNGDGEPDIVVANYCVLGSNGNCANGTTGNVASGSVGVLLGNGDGTFRPATSFTSGGKVAWSVTIADLNDDGKPDLVVANACGNTANCTGGDGLVGVLLGNGDGTFQAALSNNSGGWYAQSVKVADVNGDGKPDLLVTNYLACANGITCPKGSVDVLVGNGDGTFQVAQSYDSGASDATSVAVADVNGDGRPDLVVANLYGSSLSNGSVGVLLNNIPFCTVPPVITVSTTPKSLWPPNGRTVTVTVSGTITDTAACAVNAKSAAYVVTDEYGQVQPTGGIILGAGGTYSFTVPLQASRMGKDPDGRQYTITVRAKDNAGNAGSASAVVTVPHDQRH